MPSKRNRQRLPARYLAVAALALVLAGGVSCSSVWDDMTSYIEDDGANDRALSNNADSEDFPKLSEVPDSPRPASSPEDLEQLAEGLVADRDDARYTNETLRSRYADDAGETVQPRPQKQTQQTADTASALAAPKASEASEAPGELADQRRVAASGTTSIRSTGSLAEERRISGTEPASAAVLEERRTSDLDDRRIVSGGDGGGYDASQSDALADSRRMEGGQTVRQAVSNESIPMSETRVASLNQNVGATGVMPISDFRALFNARFDSSGRSPYRDGNMQSQAAQVSGDKLATNRAISPGAEDMLRAQMELTPPSPPIAEEDGDGELAEVSFQVGSIPFAVGSAALNSSDRSVLKRIVKLHNKFGGIVRVIGHSSRRTRDMESGTHQWVNFQLSLDRAAAVSVELARLGVPAASVMVMGLADNEPITHEYMPLGEAENRRADIYIEY